VIYAALRWISQKRRHRVRYRAHLNVASFYMSGGRTRRAGHGTLLQPCTRVGCLPPHPALSLGERARRCLAFCWGAFFVLERRFACSLSPGERVRVRGKEAVQYPRVCKVLRCAQGTTREPLLLETFRGNAIACALPRSFIGRRFGMNKIRRGAHEDKSCRNVRRAHPPASRPDRPDRTRPAGLFESIHPETRHWPRLPPRGAAIAKRCHDGDRGTRPIGSECRQ